MDIYSKQPNVLEAVILYHMLLKMEIVIFVTLDAKHVLKMLALPLQALNVLNAYLLTQLILLTTLAQPLVQLLNTHLEEFVKIVQLDALLVLAQPYVKPV